MRRPPRLLLVLHQDPAFCARLTRLAASGYRLVEVESWDALTRELAACGPASVAVVDPYHGSEWRGGPAQALATLLKALPSATVVAALSHRPGWLGHVRALGEWGIAEVIDLSTENTLPAVQMRVAAASGRRLRALVAGDLPLRVPGRARAVLEGAVDTVAKGGHPHELARALGISGHTLARWCSGSGLPVPRRLLMWVRVLLAAEQLDDPGRSTLDVAFSCGYSSDRALRRALYETVEIGPRALRQAGAFAVAGRRFVREITGGLLDVDAQYG